MAGTFWVPLRRSLSCPPPRCVAAKGTPFLTMRAPAPFGPPNLCPVMLTRWAPSQCLTKSSQAVAWTASV